MTENDKQKTCYLSIKDLRDLQQPFDLSRRPSIVSEIYKSLCGGKIKMTKNLYKRMDSSERYEKWKLKQILKVVHGMAETRGVQSRKEDSRPSESAKHSSQ